jgi:tRNA A-37 threonylcarbamoyl transferase component Bud32
MGEVLRIDLQARWQRGDCIEVEEYLAGCPPLREQEDALLDLIYSEFVQRCLRGERPRPEDFLARFPQYQAPLQRQFELHRLLENGTGAPPEGTASLASAESFPTRTPEAAANGDSLHPSCSPLPERIGRYRVVSILGEGGQAVVYRGVHPDLGLDVVIKLSRRQVPEGEARADRLLHEGRLLAGLSHPSLARVYDFGIHEGRPFLVMEYVQGRSLDQHVLQIRPGPRASAELVAVVAEALESAHRAGLIHLDLKPQNLLIDVTGRPRLIDFGLALLQSAWSQEALPPGALCGSAQYMAPEQARGETDRIDQRADIFALGGVLYFLLVGRAPYPGESLRVVLDHARHGAWDRGALAVAAAPRRLKAVCARALSADAAERYPRAADLAAALRAWLRRRTLWTVVAAVALALGLGWLSLWGSEGQPQQGPAGAPPAPAPSVRSEVRSGGPGEAIVLPRLGVRVWRASRYLDLLDAVPVHGGSELRVEITIPARMYGTLFLVNGQSRLFRLQDVTAAYQPQPMHYPQADNRSAPLEGPPGSEFVLACVRKAGPPEASMLQEWLNSGKPLPALPAQSVLRLRPGGVRVEQHGRDLGTPRDRPDPEGEVRRRLDELRLRLLGPMDSFDGVVFAHPN